MMPLAYSISEGISIGMISYVLVNLLSGHRKRLTVTMYILTVFFLLKYLIG
jgi:AGZA family xanthine/uracil permease-like MFS transporter